MTYLIIYVYNEDMKNTKVMNINIQNIDRTRHMFIKTAAAAKGISIKQFVVDLAIAEAEKINGQTFDDFAGQE